MLTNIEHDRVTVGLDGTDASLAALRYAANEAGRVGAPLELIHVMSSVVPPDARRDMPYPLTPSESKDLGSRILADGLREAAALMPESVSISKTLLEGDRVSCLVAATVSARRLVLGDQQHSVMDRVLTGSVAAGVSRHANVPVIVVPEQWLARPSKGTVAVGVRDIATSRGLVRKAFETAQDHGDALLVVHAWRPNPTQWETAGHAPDLDGQLHEVKSTVDALVRDVAGRFPKTDVEVRLVRGLAETALRHASADSDLLVLALRPGALRGHHFGRTARALLRETYCPVEILPPSEAVWPAEITELERNGEFLVASD